MNTPPSTMLARLLAGALPGLAALALPALVIAEPAPDIEAGRRTFESVCAACHGPDANANLLRVKNATTVARLDAAISGVGSMRSLATSMSAQDKLDIAAYLASLP